MPHASRNKRPDRWKRGLLALVLTLALIPASSAWASDDDLGQEEETLQSIDPLEPLNRVIFDFNEVLDDFVFLPLAHAYRFVFPQPVRDSFRNFTRNLNAPFVLVNDVLQGEGKRAEITLHRFLINTTLGVAGLFDAAKDMGLPHHDEDFGQTLGVWGVDKGIYLVLPILGPSTIRDGLGKVGDAFMNPLYYYVGTAGGDTEKFLFWLKTAEGIDTRERLIEPIAQLKKDPLTLDSYILFRSIFLQRRNSAILNKR